MEPQERTIDHLHLENALSVYFIDRTSLPVAGRCRVRLLIRVPVQPVEAHFKNFDNPSSALSRLTSLTGPGPVEFQIVKIRNFIALKDVEETLTQMKNDFIRSGLKYLENPGFAAKFIAGKYEELCAKDVVRRAQEKALCEMEGK
jgi:hypothetical protein